MVLTSVAGPLSNFIFAFIALVGMTVIYRVGITNDIAMVCFIICSYLVSLNIGLGVFNLIPIPPLDGSRILFVLLPDKAYFGIMKYEQYIYLGLIACLAFGLLDGVLSFVISLFTMAFDFIAGFFPFL